MNMNLVINRGIYLISSANLNCGSCIGISYFTRLVLPAYEIVALSGSICSNCNLVACDIESVGKSVGKLTANSLDLIEISVCKAVGSL